MDSSTTLSPVGQSGKHRSSHKKSKRNNNKKSYPVCFCLRGFICSSLRPFINSTTHHLLCNTLGMKAEMLQAGSTRKTSSLAADTSVCTQVHSKHGPGLRCHVLSTVCFLPPFSVCIHNWPCRPWLTL